MNRKYLIFFISLFVTGFLSASSGINFSIILKGQASIQEEIIFLKEIADIRCQDESFQNKLNEVIIGNTPKSGLTRFITRYDILRALRSNRIGTENLEFSGSASTEIHAAGIMISEERVLSEAKEYLMGIFDWKEADFQIRMKSYFKNVYLSKENVKLSFQMKNRKFVNGVIYLNLDLIQDKKRKESINLSFHVSYFEKVWVLAVDVNKGESISKNALLSEKRDMTKIREEPIENQSEIIGKVAVKKLKRGTVLTDKCLIRKLLIKRGQMVNMVFESGLLKASITGKALDKGFEGDFIRVKNIDSGRIISGIVEDANKVRIK